MMGLTTLRPLLLMALVFMSSGSEGRPQVLMLQADRVEDSVSTSSSLLAAAMSSMQVESEIRFRYARTSLSAFFRNPDSSASRLAHFDVLLPSDSFVSNFSMVAKNKQVVAEVREKKEAREMYQLAVKEGRGAGLAESRQSGRDVNRVVVEVNVEPESKVEFRLVYEQLLPRRNNKYEHRIRLDLPQITTINAEVKLNESRALTTISADVVKSDEINVIEMDEKAFKDEDVFTISRADSKSAKVAFSLDKETQSIFANEDGSVSLELQVNYEVDRKSDEVQVIDGYFVHFFSPSELPTLPKHVVFVLDVSGSMSGEKLRQTKDAMVTVLDALSPSDDYFNVITFSSNVRHWAPDNEKLLEGPHSSTHMAKETLKQQALRHVLNLEAGGGTNIHDALQAALDLVEVVQADEQLHTLNSMIVFLTDGSATSGITADNDIRQMVRTKNKMLEIPIYCLAFGRSADFELLKQLANDNFGLARRIYEGADAALQLEDFYNHIGSPLLADLKIDYVGELLENVTNSDVKLLAMGQEMIVAGKIKSSQINDDADKVVEVAVTGRGKSGEFRDHFQICFRKDNKESIDESNEQDLEETNANDPVAIPLGLEPRSVTTLLPLPPWPCFPLPVPEPEPRSESQNFVERLWAFRTINELLKKENSSSISNALELSLKYNFVTPLTSLVLENDDVTRVVDPEPVEIHSNNFGGLMSSRRFAAPTTQMMGVPFNFRTFADLPAPAPAPASAPAPGRPIVKGFFEDDIFDDDQAFDGQAFDDDEAFDDENEEASEACVLSLYASTYLRGNATVIASDVSSLSSLSFDDKLTSLRVSGPCCWRIFVDDNFQGDSILFTRAEYPSASQMGKLFRNASSVKKTDSCQQS